MADRVLMINNYHYVRGGAEKVFLETAEGFEARGWRVSRFSMHHPLNLPSPWAEHFVEEIEFDRLEGMGAKLRAAAKIVWSREAQRRIRALVAAEKPTLAHAHQVYHHISPAIFPTLHDMGVPTIMTAHDLKIACPAYKMLSHGEICERCKGGRVWNVALRACLKDSRSLSLLIALESGFHKMIGAYSRHLDWIVAPSKFYRQKFIEWGFREEKIVYIPNFAAVSKVMASDAGSGAIYFGRLSQEKGLATLVRAAALSQAPVTIVGRGEQGPALRALAAQLAAPVRFIDHLHGEELWDVVRAARVAVLPSEWYENAPLSVLEAFSMGKPVIGADIGGIPELIRPGETGWVFPSGDAERLAAALRAAAGTPDAAIREMGRAGAEHVAREFSRERYFDDVAALYARARAA